jgi:hypothetical protein
MLTSVIDALTTKLDKSEYSVEKMSMEEINAERKFNKKYKNFIYLLSLQVNIESSPVLHYIKYITL